MKEAVRPAIFCLFFLTAFFLSSFPAAWAGPPETPATRILILNSYHQSMQWEQDIFRAVHDTLPPLKNNVQLHFEHMDTKRVPYTDAYREKLLALYRHKYAGMKFSVIIATDNNAFNLMRNYRDTLFPGTPVVFCGVNFFRQDMLDGLTGFTGVAETFDPGATLDLALKLHPDTAQVLFINDYLPTGRAWTHTIKKVMSTRLPDIKAGLKITYAGDLPMADLLKQVNALPEKSLVIYGVYFRDSNNIFYPPMESTLMIAGASPVPVYGLLDFNLGHGIIGGKLISGYYQGKTAASIARRILTGTAPEDIPVLYRGVNRFMFDQVQLDHWGISPADLPKGAIIINQPTSFYRDHKQIVWLILVSFALLSAVIFVLTLAIRRQKLAEKNLLQLQKTLEEKVADRTCELHNAMEIAEKTSRELKVTSTEMQSILDNSPIGIVFTTNDRIIRQVNAEIIKISGYTMDEILGQTARDIFMSEQAFGEFGKKAYPELMKRRTVEDRIQLRKKDGTTVWCNVRGRLISQGDDTQGIIWILSDISGRMAAEEERQAIARELEQAQRYKSLNVMAGAIAHHYNNIMTSVQGNIELLLMGLPESSKIRRLAVNALNSAQKASQMSTSMLVYVGQQKVDPMALDLGHLINDLQALLKNNIRPNTEIILEQENVPLVCEADPAQVRELILNLVINADESIPDEGGRITIWTSTACIKGLDQPTPFRDVALSAENYICCQISDNGAGMDKETFDHMFEPFFSTKFTGRGLGLSIVAGILKAHRGTMEVRSAPDEGTVIRFYLPAAPHVKAISTDITEASLPTKELPRYSGKVIFADDHLEAARIGETQLHRLGFEVILASNGQEAIDLYRQHGKAIALVILDAVMPTVSGTDALNRIRKIDPNARIILVSGYSKDQIEPDLSDAKPDVFLQKPYKMDQLLEAVARIMGS